MNQQLESHFIEDTMVFAEERSLSDIQKRLMNIDWSFVDRKKASAIESIHPYPAKFIGDIPRALLATLPVPPNTLVFDPFAGSGTTLVEAQRKGLESVGVDLNPIACLIARVKTSKTPESLVAFAKSIIDSAKNNRTPKRWSIPNIDHWFRPEIQEAVAAVLQEINSIRDRATHDALRLALSSILVRVSNQESDTRYAAIDKDVTRRDVFMQFESAVKKLNTALLARKWDLPKATVLEANTLEVCPLQLPGKVGIVITSPPYPNAYEYWLYHKYRMWWLGFDPLSVKEQEIGARAHFFKKDSHTADNFIDQMRATLVLIRDVLALQGYACFVIGRSKIHGELIDNANIIQRVAESLGFEVISRIERVISSSRKSFNLSHANIKTESVVVLQKVKQ